jgi:hypothetical protein
MPDLPNKKNTTKKYSISEIASLLLVSTQLLRKWETLGYICPQRNEKGYRTYTHHDILKLKNIVKDRSTKQYAINRNEVVKQTKSKKEAIKVQMNIKGMYWAAIGSALALATGIFLLAFNVAGLHFTRTRILGISNILSPIANRNVMSIKDSIKNEAVLGQRDKAVNYEFNVNVPTNLAKGVVIKSNAEIIGDASIYGSLYTSSLNLTGTGSLSGLDEFDATTKTTLETTLEVAGDVTGTLGATTIAPGSIGGAELADTITYAGTITFEGDIQTDSTVNLTNEVQADGDEGSDGQVLSSTGSGVEWIDIDGDSDAETLDGVEPGEFLRSNTSDAYTSGTLSFSDGTYLDLSAIKQNDTAPQGLKLPQGTTLSAPSSGEGYLAYDTDDDTIYIYDGSSWASISGAATTLQEAYVAGNQVLLSAGEEDIRFYNDGSAEMLFMDESSGRVGIGNTAPAYKLDVTGTLQATGLRVNSETVTDFSGTGITVTGGALTSTLGTSIITTEITDDTILEVDFDATNSPTDGLILSFDNATGGFTWLPNDGGTGASKWTDAGNTTYLTSITDDLAIGGDSLTSSIFAIDESEATFYVGYDNSSSPEFLFEADDGDQGTFGFNNSDAFYISGANFIIGAGAPGYEMDVTGEFNADTVYINDSQVTSTATEINILDGTTTSTTELNLLTGRTGTLLDTSNISSNATTGVTAGTGLTGGGTVGVLTVNVIGGSGITANANDIELGVMTEDWDQTGAYDIVLNNASSELKILESAGATYYATVDAGDLAGNTTYTLSGATGTIVTDSNAATELSSWDQDSSDDLTTGTSFSGDVSGVYNNLQIGSEAVGTTELANDSILEIDLDATNGPTDNYILAYDNASGGFTWVEETGGSGTSKWTDGGTTTYLTSLSDDLGIGHSGPSSELFFDTSASALTLNPFGTSSGNTGEIRLSELVANGTSYTGFKAPDSLASNIVYEMPSANGTADYVLTWQTGSALEWKEVTSVGSAGDITAVGSMGSGDTFAGATADDDWLGLGAAAGRIEFDDLATDEVNILSANVGIGTTSPGYTLDVNGTAQATGFRVNSEIVTDWAGTGITVSGGALTADLGTSIETGEIAEDEILEINLDLTNSPTNNYILTYDETSGGFTWEQDQTDGDEKVGIDSGATAGYLGAASNDGVLRASSPISYSDGGDYITLGITGDAIGDTQLAFNTGQHLTTTSTPTFDTVTASTSASIATLNSVASVDSTTENTVEATIFDSDAQNVSGVWEVQDNTRLDFGNEADFGMLYDETTDDRFELVDAGSNVFLDITDQGTTAEFAFNVDDFFINDDGNVGIGTVAPSSLLSISSTSTSTGFTGFDLDWSPGSSTTLTGDLFSINIGSDGTADNLFAIYDNSSDVFTVTESQITSAVPHQFTATGDVSMSYDLILTNQTASKLETYGPFEIEVGQDFENNDFALTTYGTGALVVNAAGGSEFTRSGATVATYDRTSDDGAIISLKQAGTEEGTISVSGATVSYNGFTGSHYAWASPDVQNSLGLEYDATTGKGSYDDTKRGLLVTLTGTNSYLNDRAESEILYGIDIATVENDSRVLGAYLAPLEINIPTGTSNPLLVTAVGNADIWVVDTGENIQRGDYLIAASTPGHAQVDSNEYEISYIVARAAENVDWTGVDEVVEDTDTKHKRISIFFESFTIDRKSTLENIATREATMQELQTEIALINTVLGITAVDEEAASTLLSLTEEITAIYNQFKELVEGLGLTKTVDTEGNDVLAINSDLTITGATALADLTITGDVMAGLIKIDTINNSIGIVGPECEDNEDLCEVQTLYLQKSLAGNVDILDGAVVIEPSGDTQVKGTLTTNKLAIETEEESDKSAGKAIISAGNTSVSVTTSALTDTSLVLVTPKGAPVAVSTENIDSDTFEIRIEDTKTKDITVDWLIVDIN